MYCRYCREKVQCNVVVQKGAIMTGTHKCLFCGTELRIEHKRGRIAEYCSPHCQNARKFLNAFIRELGHVNLDKCGTDVRSELFMIANTVVKARNCRGGLREWLNLWRRSDEPALWQVAWLVCAGCCPIGNGEAFVLVFSERGEVMGRLAITHACSGYELLKQNLSQARDELAEAADDVFSMVDGDNGRLQRLGERYGLLKELEHCFRMNGWNNPVANTPKRK